MSERNYTNKGVIFKNKYKSKETHPEYRGTINVDGIEKEIALFVNKDKNGNHYFGAVISEPYKKPDQSFTRQEAATPNYEERKAESYQPTPPPEKDDLPF